jgi:hypothetical protein
MGIFEKLKNNFSHGGVSLLLVTPVRVDANDPILPVKATISSKSVQHLNTLTLSLTAKVTDPNVPATSNDSPRTFDKGLIIQKYTLGVDISPGNDIVYMIDLPLQLTSFNNSNSMIGGLEKIAANMNNMSEFGSRRLIVKFAVTGIVDVEGVSSLFDTQAGNWLEIDNFNYGIL